MKIRLETNRIILHHSISNPYKTTREDIYAWHVMDPRNNYSDIGYHYMINGYGEIIKGRNEIYQGAHAKFKNHDSIGICLFGDFSKYPPTYLQMMALNKLHRALKLRYPGIMIEFHRKINNPCPGKFLQKMF